MNSAGLAISVVTMIAAASADVGWAQGRVDHVQLCVDAVKRQRGLTLRVDRYNNDGLGWVVSGRVEGGKRAGCLFDGDRVKSVSVYD